MENDNPPVQTDNTTPTPTPPPAPDPVAPAAPAPEPAATPAPPPAAKIVVENTPSEREKTLAAELAEERQRHTDTAAQKKEREQRIAELEDELFRLRKITEAPAPSVKKRRGCYTMLDFMTEN